MAYPYLDRAFPHPRLHLHLRRFEPGPAALPYPAYGTEAAAHADAAVHRVLEVVTGLQVDVRDGYHLALRRDRRHPQRGLVLCRLRHLRSALLAAELGMHWMA